MCPRTLTRFAELARLVDPAGELLKKADKVAVVTEAVRAFRRLSAQLEAAQAKTSRAVAEAAAAQQRAAELQQARRYLLLIPIVYKILPRAAILVWSRRFLPA